MRPGLLVLNGGDEFNPGNEPQDRQLVAAVSAGPGNPEAAQLIAAQLKEASLRVTLKVVDSPTFVQQVQQRGGETAEVLGKPAGSDLAQGTITLPVIYYLQTATPAERAMVLDGARVREAVAAIASSTAVARARARADELVAEAQSAVAAMPEGDARWALQEMARFAVHRTH